jgi:hypothetical protein
MSAGGEKRGKERIAHPQLDDLAIHTASLETHEVSRVLQESRSTLAGVTSEGNVGLAASGEVVVKLVRGLERRDGESGEAAEGLELRTARGKTDKSASEARRGGKEWVGGEEAHLRNSNLNPVLRVLGPGPLQSRASNLENVSIASHLIYERKRQSLREKRECERDEQEAFLIRRAYFSPLSSS